MKLIMTKATFGGDSYPSVFQTFDYDPALYIALRTMLISARLFEALIQTLMKLRRSDQIPA